MNNIIDMSEALERTKQEDYRTKMNRSIKSRQDMLESLINWLKNTRLSDETSMLIFYLQGVAGADFMINNMQREHEKKGINGKYN